jgi:hypothetical protein
VVPGTPVARIAGYGERDRETFPETRALQEVAMRVVVRSFPRFRSPGPWLAALGLTLTACGSSFSSTTSGTAGAGGAETTTSSGTAGGGAGSTTATTSSTSSSGAGGTGGAATECPVANFLDLTNAPGAGASYPKPTLSVSCDADFIYVASNGIPDYTFVQTTPNALFAHDTTFKIPRHPAAAATTTTLSLLGSTGVAVNGMPFYGPNEAAQPANQAYGDPVYNGLLDECLGHTSPGEYHYHALNPVCLVQSGVVATPWDNAALPTDQASPLLAYAFDGFAVYGPYDCTDSSCTQVVEEQSSYVKTGDPTTNAWSAYTYTANQGADYLDACNGHVGSKGFYHYHATKGFPYINGCFKGTPQAQTDSGMGTGTGTGSSSSSSSGGAGPKTCTSASDCTGACPSGSKGCTCAAGMGGQDVCVPTCTTNADCPMGMNGQLTCNVAQGICVP